MDHLVRGKDNITEALFARNLFSLGTDLVLFDTTLVHEAEERDRKQREEIIENAREDLKKKGAKAFVVRRGLRRFVELGRGELVWKEACYDGTWVLRSNTDLPPGEVALAYKSLWQVEHAFRELKERVRDEASVLA